jgi:hypothetical protein
MALRSYIPIDKNNLPEQFEFPFGNEIFVIGVNYNQSQSYFTIDLFQVDLTPIIIGEKITANCPLWSDFTDPRLPLETIVPMVESAPDTPITFDNFGVTAQLFIDNLAPSQNGGS